VRPLKTAIYSTTQTALEPNLRNWLVFLAFHRATPPPAGAAIVWDSLGWLNSIERIRSFADMRDATIIFGHDPNQIKEIRLAPEEYYD